MYQKAILVCILIYLLAVFGQFGLPPDFRPLLAIGVLGLGLVGTVFVFLLAAKVYQPAIGILLGLLTLIPIVGLLVLLRVNAKATSILRDNGVRVGLLGARMSDFRDNTRE